MKKYLFIAAIFVVPIYLYRLSLPAATKNTYADDVQFTTAKDLMQMYNLGLNGFGGSSLGGLKHLSLNFTIGRPLTIEEGRRLALSCFEIFLRNINNHAALRPFLVEYPFPPSRV